MNTRIVFAVAVISAASSAGAPNAGELAFEGLRQTYASVSEVRVTLRNTGPVPVNLDSFQPDLLLVERQTDDRTTWVKGSAWRCTNAGVGTPRAVAPGSTMEVPLLKSWAFGPGKTPLYFEAESGDRSPLRGRYRVTVRYSLEPWSDIMHIPRIIKTVVSTEFEVK